MKARPSIPKLLIVAAVTLLFCAVTSAQQVYYPSKVVYAVKHDTSPPLSELIAKAPKVEAPLGPPREMRSHAIPEAEILRQPAEQVDPVVQEQAGTLLLMGPVRNFNGINNLANVYPPDPNGDIGPNHYIQTVNTHFAIYDTNGTLLSGPALLSTLWDSLQGPWSGHNDGDPIVLYDHLAGRWVISQFAILAGAPDYELVAVSATSNPLGSWHRYAFQFSDFPDYPKLAVWPDAYYMTINRFNDQGSVFLGMEAVALERDSILVGKLARMVHFENFTDHLAAHGLLPSDLDGPLPPSGTPNQFAYVVDGETQGGTDRLGIYALHVDWTQPSNSTFTGPTILTPAPFNRMCTLTRSCIPQYGTTQGLDLIGDRLMYRLQYRNFGSYQAMVTNHSVNAGGGRAGIRWYELRKAGSTWSIHQQGTYAPTDNRHRWMGSIGMDKYGNIALGYTVSSDSMYPAIRYTGRRLNDPLGQMTAVDSTIIAGTGAQTGDRGRWGDYSMMAVDPDDGMTFWFTHEYLLTTGPAPWRTRIAAFRFGPLLLTVDQQLQGGARVDSIGHWEGGPSFATYAVPKQLASGAGAQEVLRSAQKIISGEKYNQWQRGGTAEADVTNHHLFNIDTGLPATFSSQLRATNNATIQAQLLDGGNPGGSVEFKDPWLIDYPNPNYGNNLRNQGMSAPFKTVNYAANNLGTSTAYKGVFLNQNPNFLPDQPTLGFCLHW